MDKKKIAVLVVSSTIALVSSCSSYQEAICRNASDCTATRHGLIVGGSGTERKLAVHELEAAASTFSEWTGDEAPFGVVVLRNARKMPSINGLFRPWVLYFDVTETGRVEKTLPDAIAHPEGVHLAALPDGGPRYDDGDLAHEICHRYVDRISGAEAGRRHVPDLVNEAAAISCEPSSARRRQIAGMDISRANSFSSAGFFDIHNPLTLDPQLLAKAGIPVGDEKPHTITFTIESGSRLSKSVADFYGQAAVLQEYLRRNRCGGLKILGSLLRSSTHVASFASWLSDRPAGTCLDYDTRTFDRNVVMAMARH